MSFSSRGDWTAWLAENHADAAGVWLRLQRKTPGSAALTHAEALEAAIAHGWIDGTRKRLDERHYAPAVHAAAGAQQVVEDQPRQGCRADRAGRR